MYEERTSGKDWLISIAATLGLVALLAFGCYWLAQFSLATFAAATEGSQELRELGARPRTARRAGGQVAMIGLLAMAGSVVCGLGSLAVLYFSARYSISHLRSSATRAAR